MAKTTTEEKTKDAEGAAETPAPAKSGGMMTVLAPALIVGVVLGGVGFALAYFVIPSRLAAAPAPAAAAAPAATAATPAAAATPAPAAPGDEKTRRTAEELAAEGGKAVTKFTIEDLTVNIADTRGNRFVRVGVFFEAEPPVLEELEANRARMIDTVGQVLSTKTLDELTSSTIRGSLRNELIGIINPTLKQGQIENLYFTDLLVQ